MRDRRRILITPMILFGIFALLKKLAFTKSFVTQLMIRLLLLMNAAE